MFYNGYAVSWEEPPATGAGWVVNIAGSDRARMAKLEQHTGQRGAYIITRPARAAALDAAIALIDALP